MAIVKMKRIRLIALESDRAELFRRLQRMGCLHLSEPPSDSAQWEDLLHREDDHTADRQGKHERRWIERCIYPCERRRGND